MADDKGLDQLHRAVQDLFILQALQAGAKGEDVRQLLQVNQWRVTNIYKMLKAGRKVTK
jgi:hypothetical protein